MRHTSIRKMLLPLVSATLGSMVAPTFAQDGLEYVAVEPCRVADTRLSSNGVIFSDTTRNFEVTGTAAELGFQGGSVDCPNPREEEPVAVAAYILAAVSPNTGSGNLFAFPSDTTPGPGSTVNFREEGNIGNTTIVSLCTSDSCPSGGPLAVRSNFAERHVLIDVQGYFYPVKEVTQNNKGYVFASDPDAAEYTPDPLFSFNSTGGGITITRSSPGTYQVTFEGFGQPDGGNVQVTKFSGAPGNCQFNQAIPSGPEDQDRTIDIFCYDINGNPLDSFYTVLYNNDG